MEIQEEDIHAMRVALSGVEDPRRQWGFIRHKLEDLLVIGLCSIIIRGEGFDEMEELGKIWEPWFRKFLELPNGIPDEDTFRRIFERVNPVQLLTCLQQWLVEKSLAGGREVNIDGKTIRGSAKARIRTACDISFLSGKKQWKDIKTMIEYRCERTIQGETKITDKYYISSKDAAADEFGRIIRNHRSIGNNLHWALDVSFGEDGCRARKDNSPKNLTVLRKIALGRLRAIDAGKRVSLKRKMFRASLSPDFLHKILFGE